MLRIIVGSITKETMDGLFVWRMMYMQQKVNADIDCRQGLMKEEEWESNGKKYKRE